MEAKKNYIGKDGNTRDGSPWRIARRKLKSDWIALTSFFFIVFCGFISLLGYLIAPDSTPFSNQQHLELATRKPGFSVTMILLSKTYNIERKDFIHRMLVGQESIYREIPINGWQFSGDELVIEEFNDIPGSIKIISQLNLARVVYPISTTEKILKNGEYLTFTTINGQKISTTIKDLQIKFQSEHIKNRYFLLGTDRFGRDMLSRLIIGARVSISVGFIAVAISLIIGIALGAIAGFYRGVIVDVIMWFVNVVWSVPTLLMVIALTMVIGKGFWQIFIAVGLTMWVEVARVVRGQVLSLREKEFVEACKVMGYSNSRTIFKHILPNILSPVIIISAGNFATAILIESGLSFLGIGVQPPVPSWGTMIKDHYGYIIMDKAYLAILPGIAIMLLVLAFNLLGNGLRDALDPRAIEKN